MTANSGKKSGGKTAVNTPVSTPILVAAVAIALLLVVGLAWYRLVPHPEGAPARALTAQEQANKDWVKQKAREVGGDYNKLSPEDQRKLISIDGPRAPFDFHQEARSVVGNH